MQYWQVAAGAGLRNYADLCIKLGVILNGPGWAGRWPECRADPTRSGISAQKMGDLRRFCEEVQDGDVVVLRFGTKQAHAVGRVRGTYSYEPLFADVDGWDLQHVRRVEWLWPTAGDAPKEFSPPAFNFGNTTQPLPPGPVFEWAEDIVNRTMGGKPPKELPKAGELLSPEELVQPLFDYGLSSGSLNETTVQIADLVRLARWYRKFRQPSERETVCHVVVPLLRAIGWTAQKMALEWNYIDVALFGRIPRENASLAAVVEAKAPDESIWEARQQAFGYAILEGRQACRRAVVTNGFRYAVFIRDGSGEFMERPAGYLNLASPTSAHPIRDCPGAGQALLSMSADWVPDASPGPEHAPSTVPDNV